MDKRLIFIIIGVLLMASTILVLKKCTNSSINKPTIIIPKIELKEGDSISFRDETRGAARWKWNFGDGGTSIKKFGYHQYLSAGKYPVSVKVHGSFNGVLVDSTTFLISVYPNTSDEPKNAKISIDGPAGAVTGERVVFVCSTPNVLRYSWKSDETGQIFDTTKKAAYIFRSEGLYKISLTAIMSDNSTGYKSIDVSVKGKSGNVIKNTPEPIPISKPPLVKIQPVQNRSPTEIEADIKKTLEIITNSNGDLPKEYYTMISKYFCENSHAIVTVNSGKSRDISSYCSYLIFYKGTKIQNVKVTMDPRFCITSMAVNQISPK